MSMSRIADNKTVADAKKGANTKTGPDSNEPYGTEPRRSLYPLIFLIVLFGCWFAFLIALAIREAALR
jgi:hypothetical protein